MHLSHLHAFLRVATLGSFTGAARELRLPTSSVSRMVARLEKDLGAELLDRTTRHVALTALGRTYFEHATRAMGELSEGARRLGESQREPHGEVRVAVPADLDDGFFARCLAGFSAAYPRIRVTCVVGNRYVDLVSEGFDLAVRVAYDLPDSSLVARPLGRYRAWLVASPDYLARRGHPKHPADLARHDCILTVPKDGRSRWVLVGPDGEHTVEVRGRLAVDDLRFVRDLVLAGGGIGVLPIAPGAAEPHAAGLVRVLPSLGLQAPTLFAVVPTAKRLPARVSAFRGFLISAYAAAGGSPRSEGARPEQVEGKVSVGATGPSY